MKNLNLLALACLLGLSTLSASAVTSITYVGTSVSSTMPGSPTDFDFVGQSSPWYHDDSSNQTYQGTSDLTDFSLSVGDSITHPTGEAGIYSTSDDYATISAPTGYVGTTSAPATLQTGVAFAPGNAATDLATFTLGSSTSFNYSDFYVYVMFSNYKSTVHSDADLDLTLGSDALVQPVTDVDLNSFSKAQFALFHVTGGSSGDLLEIGATSTTDNGLIGGVSFIQSIPEPSTFALLLGGVGLMLGVQRFRRIA